VGGLGGRGRTLAGLAISLVALVLVVQAVDLGAAGNALRRADPRWLLLLAAAIGVDVAVRALRWRVLLAPVAKISYRLALGALLVGYLANNVLPARLGELVRAHVLGDRAGISRSTVLGTVVVERAVDTAVAVGIAAVAIIVLSVRGIVASAVMVGLAATALLVVLLAVALVAHRLPGAERATAVLARWPAAAGILAALREGLAVAGHPRTMAAAIGLSVLGWSATVIAFAAAAQAVGVEPTTGQAALLAAGTNLATAVPSAPGYLGTYELAAVAIARSVGLGADRALAFAVLVHATVLLSTSLGGAIAMVAGGLRVRTTQVADPDVLETGGR
jgi:glycosyltransferase 2 family protein